VISMNAASYGSGSYGLLTSAGSAAGCGGGGQEKNSPEKNRNEALSGGNGSVVTGLNGPNMVGAAFTSAALVTENMTQLGIKNFSLLGLFVCLFVIKFCIFICIYMFHVNYHL